MAQAAVTERWLWKKRKKAQKSAGWIFLLVMPKYWGKQIFSPGSFPEVGQKQKTERKKRLNDGNNNGQRIANATSIGAKGGPKNTKSYIWFNPQAYPIPFGYTKWYLT